MDESLNYRMYAMKLSYGWKHEMHKFNYLLQELQWQWKNLQHNISVCESGSFEQEESFILKMNWPSRWRDKRIWSMVKFENRLNPCAQITSNEKRELTFLSHVRQKGLFSFILNRNNVLFVQLRIKGWVGSFI